MTDKRPNSDGSRATNDVDVALDLIADLEGRVPETYRADLLRVLLPHRLRPATATEASASSPTPKREARRRLDLESYGPILVVPGKMLLKSLAALEVGAEQLGIEWMTPAEIERFLSDRARVGAVYRTNISNALRAARHYADRRRRGRAYEYRITVRGRQALHRELLIQS